MGTPYESWNHKKPIKAYNDARQRCPGCAMMRSAAQFTEGTDYCGQCRARGINTPKSTARRPL